MKIIFYNKGFYDDDWSLFFGYEMEDFSENDLDECLHIGDALLHQENFNEVINKYSKNYFLPLGGITCFFTNNINKYLKNLNFFDKIFTNEKIVEEFLVNLDINCKFIGHGFPTRSNELISILNKVNSKDLDCIYSGFIYDQDHLDIVNVIKNYSHIYTSNSKNKNYYLNFFDFFNVNKSFGLSKMQIYNLTYKAKLGICINLLYLNHDQINFFSTLPRIKKMRDYDYIMRTKNIPNWKGRLFDLSMFQSIMIIKKDKWNLIEDDLFIPKKHFIYYENKDDLIDIVSEVLKKYDTYKILAKNAYDIIKEKNTKSLFKKILNNIKNK